MAKKVLVAVMAVMVAVGMMAQPPRQHGQQPREPQHHEQHHEQRHVDAPCHHGSEHGRCPAHQIVCATPEQVAMTLQVVGNQSFDDKKMEIAKLAVTLGHFCTEDLARVARLFSFDENRLEFLKYAHAYCEDPQNYPALRDVFSFQSNYDDLMRTLYPGLR